MPILVVFEPKDTKKILFHKTPFTIGRGVECDLVLIQDQVSRKHLQIEQEDNNYFVRDLGSTNGTLLNGKELKERQPLQHSDSIRIGATVLSFVKSEQALAAQTIKMNLQNILPEKEIAAASHDLSPNDETRPMLGKRVFISHSSKDDAFVTDLMLKLQEFRIVAWVDHVTIEAGQDWEAEIKKALGSVDAMIVVLTENSVKSHPVKAEWQYFLNQEKPLYVVRFTDVEVPFLLSSLQFVLYNDNLDAVVLDLLRNILI